MAATGGASSVGEKIHVHFLHPGTHSGEDTHTLRAKWIALALGIASYDMQGASAAPRAGHLHIAFCDQKNSVSAHHLARVEKLAETMPIVFLYIPGDTAHTDLPVYSGEKEEKGKRLRALKLAFPAATPSAAEEVKKAVHTAALTFANDIYRWFGELRAVNALRDSLRAARVLREKQRLTPDDLLAQEIGEPSVTTVKQGGMVVSSPPAESALPKTIDGVETDIKVALSHLGR